MLRVNLAVGQSVDFNGIALASKRPIVSLFDIQSEAWPPTEREESHVE